MPTVLCFPCVLFAVSSSHHKGDTTHKSLSCSLNGCWLSQLAIKILQQWLCCAAWHCCLSALQLVKAKTCVHDNQPRLDGCAGGEEHQGCSSAGLGLLHVLWHCPGQAGSPPSRAASQALWHHCCAPPAGSPVSAWDPYHQSTPSQASTIAGLHATTQSWLTPFCCCSCCGTSCQDACCPVLAPHSHCHSNRGEVNTPLLGRWIVCFLPQLIISASLLSP